MDDFLRNLDGIISDRFKPQEERIKDQDNFAGASTDETASAALRDVMRRHNALRLPKE